jgi:hypothetical protein
LAEIRTLYGIGVPGSDAMIGNAGPIRIATEWGGELGKTDQSAAGAAVAGRENAESSVEMETVGAEPKEPVR